MSNATMVANAEQFADVEGLFEDKQGGTGTYLNIFDFSICQRSKTMPADPTGWEGPFTRQNPRTHEDVISYAKRYDRMIGRIADIYKQTKEFDASKGGGKVTNWNIVLLTGGQRLTLQLVWMDRVLKRFLKVAPNIDYTRPILISAFKAMKNGDPNQAVSFRQYKGDMADREALRNVDKWEKVEEYWKGPVDSEGKRIDGPQSGADGSILPQPIQDPEDESWDYKEQNRFLGVYFRDNVLPTIKALAEQYGITHEDADASTPTHSGPPADDTPVTTRPFIVAATNINEMASGAHVARIKQLCQALNYDPDWATGKLLEAGLAELTDEAARYVIYKLEQKAQKSGQAVAPPPPPPPPVAPAPPADDDDDLWGTGPAATAPAAPVTAPYDPNSNDDIDF